MITRLKIWFKVKKMRTRRISTQPPCSNCCYQCPNINFIANINRCNRSWLWHHLIRTTSCVRKLIRIVNFALKTVQHYRKRRKSPQRLLREQSEQDLKLCLKMIPKMMSKF
jgi:hypothetical protein